MEMLVVKRRTRSTRVSVRDSAPPRSYLEEYALISSLGSGQHWLVSLFLYCITTSNMVQASESLLAPLFVRISAPKCCVDILAHLRHDKYCEPAMRTYLNSLWLPMDEL